VTRTYDHIALSTKKAVLDNVSPDGELLQFSFGTSMGDTLQFYMDTPKTAMPYSQAMAEIARRFFWLNMIEGSKLQQISTVNSHIQW
jgi:rhamnogalacturonyl hydrolase YesR